MSDRNTDTMSALLPLVKQLGGGLKSKSICMQLLKHGRKKVAVMLSQHDVLKAAYKRAKNGPIRQRKAVPAQTSPFFPPGARCVACSESYPMPTV